MSRVPVHTTNDAPEPSRDLLKQLEQKNGRVLNIHAQMAHSPAVLDLYVSAESAIAAQSALDGATRQAIHLAVSAVNGCDYCQSAYTLAAKREGLTEEQTIAIRKDAVDFDDRLAALLEVAREAAANKGHVPDTAWQRAVDAGWSHHEILDAFADVVRTILTNYFNHFVGTEIDIRKAPDLR